MLYLSPTLFLLKRLLQGLYPGTVVCIELTQTLAWAKAREPGGRNRVEREIKKYKIKGVTDRI